MTPRVGELRETPAPGEAAARRRTRAVLEAALAERAAPSRRRARRVLAPVVAGAALLLAVTSPGSAVADWMAQQVRDAVAPAPAPPPRTAEVPTGRLLAVTPAGPSVLSREGADRLLGAVDEATWSPRGLYVAAARGPELLAVDLEGRRRWSVVAARGVDRPAWSPSGFRVAYLSGRPDQDPPTRRTLRVVAGDGTGDRLVAAAGAAAPVWRPGPAHVLAHTDPAGRVVVRDADTGARLARSAPLGTRTQLSWSADGRRILAVAADRLFLLAPDGRLLRMLRAPAGTENVAAAFAPTGRRYALVRRSTRTGESRVLEAASGAERFLFAVPGPLRGLAWSPDGRWIAVGAPRAAAVVLLRPGRDGLAEARSVPAAGGALAGWR